MLRLALSFPRCHFGGWRLHDAIPEMNLGIERYVRAARLAEEAGSAILFEDQTAVPRSNDSSAEILRAASPRGIHLDPSMLWTSSASADSVSFGAFARLDRDAVSVARYARG
jgi:N-acetyl-S-(2-succino)cysteine monooxygenase